METIYPAGTYATMALTVVIFLITDALLYRPVIVLQAISLISFAALLIVGTDVSTMIVRNFHLRRQFERYFIFYLLRFIKHNGSSASCLSFLGAAVSRRLYIACGAETQSV